MTTPLEQAITLIKAGDTEKAKHLWVNVIKQNPRDEVAWLWMAECVQSEKEKRYCFEQVLKLTPDNKYAVYGISHLSNITPSKTHLERENHQQKTPPKRETKNNLIFQNTISSYVGQGYRVLSQAETTAQLVKPKQFFWGSIILLLFWVFPFFLYLLYYLVQKDESVYIAITGQEQISVTHENGQIQIINSGGQLAPVISRVDPAENPPKIELTPEARIIIAIIITIAFLALLIYVGISIVGFLL